MQVVLPMTNVHHPRASVLTFDERDVDIITAHRWMPPMPSFPNVYRVSQLGRTIYLSRIIYARYNHELGDQVVHFRDGDRTNVCIDNLTVFKDECKFKKPFSLAVLTPEELRLNDKFFHEIEVLRDAGHSSVGHMKLKPPDSDEWY